MSCVIIVMMELPELSYYTGGDGWRTLAVSFSPFHLRSFDESSLSVTVQYGAVTVPLPNSGTGGRSFTSLKGLSTVQTTTTTPHDGDTSR